MRSLHGFSVSSFLANASGKPGSSSPAAGISFRVAASGKPGSSEPDTSGGRSPLLAAPAGVSCGGMASVSGTDGLAEAGGEFCSIADVLAVLAARTNRNKRLRGR